MNGSALFIIQAGLSTRPLDLLRELHLQEKDGRRYWARLGFESK